MARTYLVSELVTSIRRRADVEKTQFVTDAEIIEYIDRSNCELYDLIVSKYNDYFMSSQTYTLGGSEFITVPADFYKLLGIDQAETPTSDRWFTLRPINFNERNKRFNTLFNMSYHPTYRYHLQNDQIRINPIPAAADVLRVWYVPAPVKITLGTQTIDGKSGWEEYIIVDCCAKIRVKQELDPQAFMVEKARLEQRILKMAQNYDGGLPARVTDTYSINDDVLFPITAL